MLEKKMDNGLHKFSKKPQVVQTNVNSLHNFSKKLKLVQTIDLSTQIKNQPLKIERLASKFYSFSKAAKESLITPRSVSAECCILLCSTSFNGISMIPRTPSRLITAGTPMNTSFCLYSPDR